MFRLFFYLRYLSRRCRGWLSISQRCHADCCRTPTKKKRCTIPDAHEQTDKSLILHRPAMPSGFNLFYSTDAGGAGGPDHLKSPHSRLRQTGSVPGRGSYFCPKRAGAEQTLHRRKCLSHADRSGQLSRPVLSCDWAAAAAGSQSAGARAQPTV